MSGVLHPAGPEPVRTYWLRRAMVVGALLVVVVVIIALVNGTSGPKPVAAIPASSTPTAQTSTSPRPASTESSTSPSSTKPAISPTPVRPAVCDPDQLKTTLTGKPVLKPKEAATFDVSLINGGDKPCRATVSSQTFSLTISSGKVRIWGSSDCEVLRPFTKELASQQQVQWKMGWNGLPTTPGCKKTPVTPQPGAYKATAQLKGAQPVDLDFAVHP